MNLFRRRRIRKAAQDLLRHARHVLNMREDVMAEADIRRVVEAADRVSSHLKSRDWEGLDRANEELYAQIGRVTPPRSFPAVRENLEIIAVAVAVAMGFRTYFIQPFKIPTGSMQPTLYGIHSVADRPRALWDRFPLKLVKWVLTGAWYTEVRAKASGYLEGPFEADLTDPSSHFYYISGRRHTVPKYANLRVRPREYVSKGTLLWTGSVTTGDHVFVDKVRWNLTKPKRGDIIVFNTDGIATLPPKTHYIKRLVGLPNERIAIDPPRLIVNGQSITSPRGIERIVHTDPGYRGYLLAGRLEAPADSVQLGPTEYFAMGDNTANSRDSRYWGAVPQENMVGPAFLVYWPFSARWGMPR